MESVFEGINSIFIAAPDSDFYKSVGGRLYTEEAPEVVEKPYCVVTDMGGTEEPGFCFTISSAAVVFALYDELQSAERILQIGRELRDLFEYQTISGSPYSIIGMVQTGTQLVRHAEVNMWEYLIGFDVTLDNEK